MFRSARLRLTIWYIAIILLISLLFSTVIFVVINREYNRIEYLQQERANRFQQRFAVPYQSFFQENPEPQTFMIITADEIHDARMRLLLSLGVINILIVTGAGFAGYLLAGRTLQPIQNMVIEQNRFITDASHELRTPLTSLKTTIEVYLRSKHHSIKEADALLTSSLEDVNQLQKLTDNLIKLSHTQQSSPHFVTEPIDLQTLVAEAIQKVQVQAKHKRITLKADVANLTIKGNRHNLLEVLVILLDNAIKYSPDKTVVGITVDRNDHTVKLQVHDQGIGIAPADLDHIFDRFYRADAARTNQDGNGYGLGLAIAKLTVEQHHGTLTVQSELHKGSTFTILLPLKQPK